MSMNRYFIKNRNRAAGIAMTLTGIGPIIFPPIIVILNELYGVNGCIFILSAISMHMIVAALLLQPVRWHLKRIEAGDRQEMLQAKEKSSFKKCIIVFICIIINKCKSVKGIIELKKKNYSRQEMFGG